MEELLTTVTIPRSLAEKGTTPLHEWVTSPARALDILGARLLLWQFCFWLYAVRDPLSGRTQTACASVNVEQFDLVSRLPQAKLFDEIGLMVMRGHVLTSALGFLENTRPLVKLLVFIEAARVVLNRDTGAGKSGLWYLAGLAGDVGD